MKYLDPKNDLTFKRIFGEHPDLVKSLLNALMPFEEGQYIKTLTYLSPELVPDILNLKNTIVDVNCIDNDGRKFIIEMQMIWTSSFQSRVLFNASKAYVRQLNRAKDFINLRPVYSLNLVNDIFETDTDKYYHHYSIVNNADTKKKIDGLEFVFVELPKYKPQSSSEKKMAILWLRFLTEIEHGTANISTDLLDNKETAKAVEILESSSFNPGELEAYEKYWMSISERKTLMNEKEFEGIAKGIDIGRVKGMVKGMVKGREKGREEGREEGMEEGIEKGIEKGVEKVARNGLKQGLSVELIMQLTQLTQQEIEQLKNDEENIK